MIDFLIENKDLITLIIAIVGITLSLYNLFKDKRKITLSYSLIKDKKSNRLILTGIFANPSKTPNSIISCQYFHNGKEVHVSRYHGGGFDMGQFFKPSHFSPIPLAQPIPPGSSIAFSEVLKLENVLPDDNLTMVVKTANYKKTFKLKIKNSF